MPAYPRKELEEMVERWLEANKQSEIPNSIDPGHKVLQPQAKSDSRFTQSAHLRERRIQ